MTSNSSDWVNVNTIADEAQVRSLAERLGLANARTGTIAEIYTEILKKESATIPITVFWLGRPLTAEIFANRDKAVSMLYVTGINFMGAIGDSKETPTATFGFTELQSEEELKKFIQTCEGKPIHIVDTVRDRPKTMLVPHYMKLAAANSFSDHVRQFLKLRVVKTPKGDTNLW